MKNLFLFFTFILFAIVSTAQSCLPGNLHFSNQEHIDNFILVNPNCTTIEGDVMIMGDDINNLNGLSNITTFEKGLWIEDCPLLPNFSGLENVTYIGGYLEVGNLPSLTDISSLSNLTYVGGALDFVWVQALTNLNGLENIVSSPTYLILWYNLNLTDIKGLRNIQSISTSLKVKENPLLADISPLKDIDLSELQYLTIQKNPLLSICHIENICGVLDNQTTNITIEENYTGCNTIEEVEVLCTQQAVEDIEIEPNSFYPNPANEQIHFKQNDLKEIKIINQLGQVILSQEQVTNTLNISSLKEGAYFISIQFKDFRRIEKLIVR